MSKPHALRLFLRLAPELSLSETRTINQTRWADELGIAQPQIHKLLEAFVDEGILLPGPREGTSNTYRVNPAYPGIQDVFNRKIA